MNIRCHFSWFRFLDTITIIIPRYGSANRPNLLVQSNTQDVMSTSATRHRLKLKRKLSLHSKLTGKRIEDLVKWERSHDQLEEYYLQVYAGYTVDAHTYCTATIIAYNRGRTRQSCRTIHSIRSATLSSRTPLRTLHTRRSIRKRH